MSDTFTERGRGIPYSLRSDLYEEIIDGKVFTTSVITDTDEWGNCVMHSPITKERPAN